MTHDGEVARVGEWTAEKFARPEGCNCYGCQKSDNVPADPAAFLNQEQA